MTQTFRVKYSDEALLCFWICILNDDITSSLKTRLLS